MMGPRRVWLLVWLLLLLEAAPMAKASSRSQRYGGDYNEDLNSEDSLSQTTYQVLNTPIRNAFPPKPVIKRARDGAARAKGKDASLKLLLVSVVHEELRHCDLVMACSAGYCRSTALQALLTLSNPRQVVLVSSVDDLLAIDWVPLRCVGYMMLLERLEPLLALVTSHHHTWNYHGRYVVVSDSLAHLEALAASRNGKKTEHLVGVVKTGREGEWQLYTNQLYREARLQPLTLWRHHTFTTSPRLFPDKLSDLHGAVLKVSTFRFEPSIMYYNAENGSLLYRYGEEISLIKAIGRVLNFTPKFAEPADGETWGYELQNGSWLGIIGDLQRDDADIAVSNLFVSSSRTRYLDYTASFQNEMACFLARVELPLPRWQALAFPFHPWTWLAILLGVVISGVVLCLLAKASSLCGDEVHSLAKLNFSWYYAFGLHFCEAQVSLPRMNSTRIFVLILWLYTMTLTIVYSTNLTAFLLVRKAPASIQTIKDLHDSGLEVATMGHVFLDRISSSSDPNLKGLVKVYSFYSKEEEVFPRVLEGKAVFLESRGYAEFQIAMRFTTGGIPRMRLLKECFAPYSVAMALQRHSPLKVKFDTVIGWVLQAGLLHHYFADSLRLAVTTKEYQDSAREERLQEEAVVPLNLDHMQGEEASRDSGVLCAGRSVLAGWILTSLVVGWAYMGGLTSLLAMRHVSQPFQTLASVAHHPFIQLVGEKDTAEVNYIQRVMILNTKDEEATLQGAESEDSITIPHHDWSLWRRCRHTYGRHTKHSRACNIMVAWLLLGYRQIWEIKAAKDSDYTDVVVSHHSCCLCDTEYSHSLTHYVQHCSMILAEDL